MMIIGTEKIETRAKDWKNKQACHNTC